MGDPFRSDLDAAHRRIEQLEDDLARARSATAGQEQETRAARRFGVAILVGVAIGVTFMLGAVRSRSRALTECSADLEHERTSRSQVEMQLLRATQTAPPPPLSLRSRSIDGSFQAARSRQVENAITQIFERSPRPGELDAWLAHAGDWRSIRDEIAHTPEVEERIQAIHKEATGRSADPDRIASFVAQLANGSSMAGIRATINAGGKWDCSTPYWIDRDGVKHYKPECIR